MNSRKISTPSKKKIKDSVVGMNSVYDFSTIASNGEIVYNQRAIECNFTLITDSKGQLQARISQIIEWIGDAPQSQLIFDDISDYYFLAELEDSIDINEEHSIAEITIKFIAEPFRSGLYDVGTDIWDTFNFEEDIVQSVNFNVVNTLTVSIYNAGRLIVPTINCSANMSVIVSGVTYNLVIGNNKIYGLKLQNGYNSIVVNGTGLIKFVFRKSVI